MNTLKAMSWNLFWGLGAPEHKLDLIKKAGKFWFSKPVESHIDSIINAITNENPDILGVQEIIHNNKFTNLKYQTTEIEHMTGLNIAKFAKERKIFGSEKGGNAIYTSLDKISKGSLNLPYFLESRNIVFSKIKYDSSKILVMNTHLSAHNINKLERVRQVRKLVKLVKSSKTPIILMGDFNCEPNSFEFKYLVKHSGLNPAINHNETFPTYNPSKIFDNILVSKEFEIYNSGIIRTKHSDHFPVYVDLILKK